MFSERLSILICWLVDGLEKLTTIRVAEAMQVGEGNWMEGLQGRTEVLIRLASAMRAHPEHFGTEGGGRPGGIVGKHLFLHKVYVMLMKDRFPRYRSYRPRWTDESAHQLSLARSHTLAVYNVAFEAFIGWCFSWGCMALSCAGRGRGRYRPFS